MSEMRGKGGLFPLRFVWVIPVAAVLTMALGVWGWLRNGEGINDALYHSLALFEINNDAYTHAAGLHDWHFRIARWFGAGAVITSLLALAALLHEQVATALARWTRQAVVVIGQGPLARGAFEAARHKHRSALWLGSPTFGTANLGTIALEWPAGDRPRVAAAHVAGAEHLLVTEDDDADAFALAKAARSAAPNAQLTLVLKDPTLADQVALAMNDPRARVLSVGAVAARALNTAHPPFLLARDANQPRIHALIVGFGTTGQAIFHDLVIACRTSFLGLPRIVIVDPAAKALEGVLRVRAPELDKCADCVFVDGEIRGSAVRPAPSEIGRILAAGGPLTAAYICVGDDAGALSAAATLQSLLRAANVDRPAIFARLRSADVLPSAGGLPGEGLKGVTPFGDIRTVLEASEFLSESPDAAARAYHAAFCAAQGPERADDPSTRPWDDLDETYRRANRNNVDHIPAKLASAGLAVPPTPGRLPKIPPGRRLYANDAELETLAALEHERWSAERRMDGWRLAPDGEGQDRLRRLHPDLRPYGDLSDKVQEYDRIFIRQTQAICGAD